MESNYFGLLYFNHSTGALNGPFDVVASTPAGIENPITLADVCNTLCHAKMGK